MRIQRDALNAAREVVQLSVSYEGVPEKGHQPKCPTVAAGGAPTPQSRGEIDHPLVLSERQGVDLVVERLCGSRLSHPRG